jgi:serine/threonine-protein kinase
VRWPSTPATWSATTPTRGSKRCSEIYAARGDKDRAFHWLERAYAQHDGGLVAILPNNCSVKCDPLLRGLHGDPRFAALLGKMNLPRD